MVWNMDSDLGVCGLRTIPSNFDVSFLALDGVVLGYDAHLFL